MNDFSKIIRDLCDEASRDDVNELKASEQDEALFELNYGQMLKEMHIRERERNRLVGLASREKDAETEEKPASNQLFPFFEKVADICREAAREDVYELSTLSKDAEFISERYAEYLLVLDWREQARTRIKHMAVRYDKKEGN